MMRRQDIFIAELTTEYQFDGRRYFGIEGATDREWKLYRREVAEQLSRSVRFWLGDFRSTVPKIGDRLVSGGETLRILDSHRCGPFIKFALGEEYARS